MEQSYWLRRKRAAAANARDAASAEARLIHFDLAGRYSIKAAIAAASAAGTPGVEARPALALPAEDGAYYHRLETGARWLASQSGSEAERGEHLGMANRYARLRADAAAGEPL